MKEKLWPSISRIAHAKRSSTQNLVEDIHNKICENFTTQVVIQYINEISMHAAAVLWHSLESSEVETLNVFLIEDAPQVFSLYIKIRFSCVNI